MSDPGSGFVTVGRFPSMVDLAVVQARLRDEGIEFLVRDDNTVNVAPQLAAAIGGARLQVRSVDVDRTLWLLAEQGIPIDREHEGSPLLEWFDARTRTLALLGRAPVALRFIILLVPVLSLVVTALFFAMRPSIEERLTGSWCVSSLTMDGTPMTVRTLGFTITYEGCDEQMELVSSGVLRFPGLASPAIGAHWRVLRGDLIVQDADTLKELFDGTYMVDLDGNHLRLSNGHVLINAERRVLRLPF